jgi:hypothetical protein
MGLLSSSCDPFDLTVSGDLDAAVKRVQALITGDGGTFAGDAAAGKFTGPTPVGTIEGKYAVRGNMVTVTITKRPRLAGCDVTEAKIRKYFAGG